MQSIIDDLSPILALDGLDVHDLAATRAAVDVGIALLNGNPQGFPPTPPPLPPHADPPPPAAVPPHSGPPSPGPGREKGRRHWAWLLLLLVLAVSVPAILIGYVCLPLLLLG